jgi:hypothetical protein
MPGLHSVGSFSGQLRLRGQIPDFICWVNNAPHPGATVADKQASGKSALVKESS